MTKQPMIVFTPQQAMKFLRERELLLATHEIATLAFDANTSNAKAESAIRRYHIAGKAVISHL